MQTLVFLLICCSLHAQNLLHQPGSIVVYWDQNTELDVTGYNVHWGIESGLYENHIGSSDTIVNIAIPDSLIEERLHLVVDAVDSSNNVSELSTEINFIPMVVLLNFSIDSTNRINLNDRRVFQYLYNTEYASLVDESDSTQLDSLLIVTDSYGSKILDLNNDGIISLNDRRKFLRLWRKYYAQIVIRREE